MPDHDHPQPDEDDQAARIKAEVDAAPPLSVRQREHLRRIFTAARATAERTTGDDEDDGRDDGVL